MKKKEKKKKKLQTYYIKDKVRQRLKKSQDPERMKRRNQSSKKNAVASKQIKLDMIISTHDPHSLHGHFINSLYEPFITYTNSFRSLKSLSKS
jgi:hypothetical protein